MAKKGSGSYTAAGRTAARKTSKVKSAQASPPPTYEKVVNELDALSNSLTTIVLNGSDANGPLDACEIQRAQQAIREIQAAKQVFFCIQGYSPYRRSS